MGEPMPLTRRGFLHVSLGGVFKDGSPLQGSAFMGVRDPGLLHPSEQRTFAGDPVYALGWYEVAPSGLGSVRLLSVLRMSSALPFLGGWPTRILNYLGAPFMTASSS